MTPLHMAAQKGCVAILTALLEKGANKDAITKVPFRGGNTTVAPHPLQFASFLISSFPYVLLISLPGWQNAAVYCR